MLPTSHVKAATEQSVLGHIGLRIQYLCLLSYTTGMETELKYWQSSSSSEDQAEDTGKKRNMKKEQKSFCLKARAAQESASQKGSVQSNKLEDLTGWLVCWLLQTPAACVDSFTVCLSWRLLLQCAAEQVYQSEGAESCWLKVCDVIQELVWVQLCLALPVWADTGGAAGSRGVTQWYLMSHAGSICEAWAERRFELIANLPDANMLLFYIMFTVFAVLVEWFCILVC